MRTLNLTLILGSLVATFAMAGQASAVTVHGNVMSFMKPALLQVDTSASSVAEMLGTGLYQAPLQTASWIGKAFLAEDAVTLTANDGVVALSKMCTKTGFCCTWVDEGRSPVCG